mmetsp:Transcript_18060/g.20922  ORF Transcript_18060/g.20922 Transcript_18060/m.20922 type:complete len:101 (+) Transcript_18060:105-407(+)
MLRWIGLSGLAGALLTFTLAQCDSCDGSSLLQRRDPPMNCENGMKCSSGGCRCMTAEEHAKMEEEMQDMMNPPAPTSKPESKTPAQSNQAHCAGKSIFCF